MTFFKYLLIFALGLALGYIVPFSPEKLGQLTNIATVLGGIATCIAAFAAVSAINSWRQQFAHAEKVRLLNNLEDSFNDLHKSLGKYRQKTIAVIKTKASQNNISQLPELNHSANESQLSYEDAIKKYIENHERLNRVTELSNYEIIRPDSIESTVIKLLNGLPPIYKKGIDLDESCRLLDENSDLLSELWRGSKLEFKTLRNRS